jgi:hypothetical protein
MQITIGADPELFLMKGEEFVSAHGVIPGTKGAPYKVECGAVQVDGMALEFNIDPAKTPGDFTKNIAVVMTKLRDMVDREYHLVLAPTAYFSKEEMEQQPPEALLLGCDPDYNAYTEQENPKVEDPGFMRVAGGHIHIGFVPYANANPKDEFFIASCAKLVKELDIWLGVPSIFLDKDNERRKLYGKAGAFRPKPYGVEYRTLSNFWLHNEHTQEWVFRQCIKAVTNLREGHTGAQVFKDIGAEINPQQIINNVDTYVGQYAIDTLGISLP